MCFFPLRLLIETAAYGSSPVPRLGYPSAVASRMHHYKVGGEALLVCRLFAPVRYLKYEDVCAEVVYLSYLLTNGCTGALDNRLLVAKTVPQKILSKLLKICGKYLKHATAVESISQEKKKSNRGWR